MVSTFLMVTTSNTFYVKNSDTQFWKYAVKLIEGNSLGGVIY